MLFFSPTYDKDVMQFAEQIVPDPIVMRLRKEESLENIKQYFMVCKSIEEKFNVLSNFYGVISIGQAIIFCHTRKTANYLSEKMTQEGHAVAMLENYPLSIAVLNRFCDGKEKVMITTNVCARGIDVEQVNVVVNFDFPMNLRHEADSETYLHRIGRTGWFGRTGLAINIVDGPATMKMLKQFENHFGRKILRLDADDADEIEKIGRQ